MDLVRHEVTSSVANTSVPFSFHGQSTNMSLTRQQVLQKIVNKLGNDLQRDVKVIKEEFTNRKGPWAKECRRGANPDKLFWEKVEALKSQTRMKLIRIGVDPSIVDSIIVVNRKNKRKWGPMK